MKIGVLSSIGGGVVEEIVKKFGNSVVAVICKTSDEDEVLKVFEEAEVDLVVLIDYFRKLSLDFISKYSGSILNVHASLLPKFSGKGMYGQRLLEKIIDSGYKISGVTIHVVEGDYDLGRIVAQKEFEVRGGIEGFRRDVVECEKELVCEVLGKVK